MVQLCGESASASACLHARTQQSGLALRGLHARTQQHGLALRGGRIYGLMSGAPRRGMRLRTMSEPSVGKQLRGCQQCAECGSVI